MSDAKWLLVASRDTMSFSAQTIVPDNNLLYRAASKWLIRGKASELLKTVWEYIDQQDNQLEESLLDQFITQGDKNIDDPQTTNLRTRDYSMDITILSNNSNINVKTCKINIILWIYLHGAKQKMRVDEYTIDFYMVKLNDNLEKVHVNNPQKTPMMVPTQYRTSKRSSKVMTE